MRVCPRLIFVSLVFTTILPVTAEKRPFDLVLKPTDQSIIYTDGYIRAPGFIDLTSLTFEPVSESFVGLGDDVVDSNDGNEEPPRRVLSSRYQQNKNDDKSTDANSAWSNTRKLDGGVETEFYSIDVAIFLEPDKCAKKKAGCDWTQLGVGAKKEDASRWCCSDDAIELGMCSYEQKGRLILQDDNSTGTQFMGEKRSINVPLSGSTTKNLKYGKFEEQTSGRYVVLFANCDSDGREVRVVGHSVWKSVHGYLPGELYGFMYFYAIMALVYVLLTVWYALLMHFNKESRIPIEKWILMTMTMGLSEMALCASFYFLWNTSGIRPMILDYGGVIVGVLKRGISRGLMVMVSLGWGVIRDSLGSTMNSIVVLAAAYIGVSAFRELMEDFYREDVTELTDEEGDEIIDLVTILTFVEAAIDVIFILWILDALNGTMQYLENMNQLRKLQRYLSLRSVLLFAILFATVWVVFQLVDSYDENGIVQEEHVWVVEAAFEVNYVLVLIGIAYLWRPNPSAREYAYVMELSASGDGDGETELELSGVVPSAMDDDDDQQAPSTNNHGNGYNDHDDRFKIDEAEAA
ncbi:hypothetical protein ACA910_010726 [Epithemia clementina (nom. ined.)]